MSIELRPTEQNVIMRKYYYDILREYIDANPLLAGLLFYDNSLISSAEALGITHLCSFLSRFFLYERDRFGSGLDIPTSVLSALKGLESLDNPFGFFKTAYDAAGYEKYGIAPYTARHLALYYFEDIFNAKAGLLLTSDDSSFLRSPVADYLHEPELLGEFTDIFGYLESIYRHLVVHHRGHIAIQRRIDVLRAKIDSLSSDNSDLSVSIVGFHKAVLGLGEDARRLADCLLAAGVRFELVDVSYAAFERDDEGSELYIFHESTRPQCYIVIICMPLFEAGRVLAQFGDTWLADKYVIGYCPWELTELRPEWIFLINRFFNEMWASTRFLQDVYTKFSTVPVYLIPLPVNVPELVDCLPSEFLDVIQIDKRIFFCCFDFNSRAARKNPIAAVRAFKSAFEPSLDEVKLVIKTMYGETHEAALKEILDEIGTEDRITLIDGVIPKSILLTIIRHSCAFISLHRAEGFGRLIAESMLLNVPVIATDWSGSRDLVTNATGFPVTAQLRDVQYDEYPFAAGQWAEPDLKLAAEYMRLIADKGAPEETVAAARRLVCSNHSIAAVSTAMLERLCIIGLHRATNTNGHAA